MSMFENGLKHLWMMCKQPETFEFHNEKNRSGLYYFPSCFEGKRGAINRDNFDQFSIEQPENKISQQESYAAKFFLKLIQTRKVAIDIPFCYAHALNKISIIQTKHILVWLIDTFIEPFCPK